MIMDIAADDDKGMKVMMVMMRRKRQEHKGAFAGGFYGPGLGVTHITLGHTPSAGT